MVYGYARCSTNESRQDIDRQCRELYSLGVNAREDIFLEYESGAKTDRPEFNKLFSVVKPGDTIATTEVSRLTRSTAQLCNIMETVQKNHLRLIIGTFEADCRDENIDPMTKGMVLMWGVFAEMEREIISQRVKSGMANAKAKGAKIGRPKRNAGNIPSDFMRYYGRYKSGELNISEVAQLSKKSRTTVYKYIELLEA